MSTTGQSRVSKQPGYLIPLTRDFVSVASLGILFLSIHELATPFLRGFHCDDETIRYPYNPSTISSFVCYTVGCGLNIIIIISTEIYNSCSNQRGFSLTRFAHNIYCPLIIWFFGALSSEFLTDISKVTAGRLRPHFIDLCKPTVKDSNGVEVSLDEFCARPSSRYQYILNYRCTNESPLGPRDARLSFMSGHSSHSAYSATFAVLYLQSVLNVAKFGMFKPTIQIIIAAAAFYTGLTRVSDYKHHWQDVLAGLLQGTLVAIVVSRGLLSSFNKVYSQYVRSPSQDLDEEQRGDELNRVSY